MPYTSKVGAGLSTVLSVFVSIPFTGKQLDKLVQHEHSESHQAPAASYMQGKTAKAL